MNKMNARFLAPLLMMAAVDDMTAASTGGMNVDPSAATGTVAAAPPPGTATTYETNFFFRTDKIRDDENKVIGTGRKHPDVKAVLPIPTYVDLINAISEGGKVAEMLLDAVKGLIEGAARAQIADWREANPDVPGQPVKNFTATNFDLSKLSLAAIANTPKGERGGPVISDEDWAGMLEDYTNTMVQVVNYDPNKVKLHVNHYKTLFRRIKSDKAAVQKLLDLLNTWASKTENLEDHVTCYDALKAKAERYLKADDRDVAGAL